jgi:3-oxoacyl-[acyl-carrier protein] reductase
MLFSAQCTTHKEFDVSDNVTGTRIALVTGAAQGIGREIAMRLARDGMHVLVSDINVEGAGAVSEEINAASGAATALPADITDEGSVREMFERIQSAFGRLDILVNNAGVVLRPGGKSPRIEETSLVTWSNSILVNLTGVFIVSKAAIPLLRKSACGRVISISSLVGQAYSDQSSYYAASKAGVFGFSRILAGELGPDGITVNCIAPGMIRTPAIEKAPGAAERLADYAATAVLKRPGEMTEIADAVAYLASPAAGFITGEILNLNGGAFMP